MHEKYLEKVFSNIEPDDSLKNKIIDRIEERNMKPSTNKKPKYIVAIAACVGIIGITTAFAAGNIISYFQSDKAVELTNMDSLAKYNEKVGTTSSNLGYTLTLDNMATDDNFLHVFYTLKSENQPIERNFYTWFDCRVNGQIIGYNNHNEENSYLEDEYTYKGVMKYNVSDINIPDTFKFEMYTEESNGKSKFEEGYLYSDKLNLTDDDISKLLYVSTTAKKTNIETESIIKDVNQKFEYTNSDNKLDTAEITKVIFSPFGNQFVVKDTHGGDASLKVCGYAMYNENGTSLDILNTDLRGARNGDESINSFEFLKADSSLKSFTLVPLKYKDITQDDASMIEQKIGTYPMTYELSEYGKIIVTGITITDGEINIDYYKDGYTQFDPGFSLLDDNGKNAEPGGKLGCVLYTRVHHDTNSYTAQYKYGAYDENGNKIPIDDTVSKENLEKHFTTLGLYKNQGIVLDYDNSITVNLK